jgi:hypothetical protein
MASGANSETTIPLSRGSARHTTCVPTSRRPAVGASSALPTTIAELREHWRNLPLTITVDQLLKAGWLGNLSRAPLYRALSRGDLPVVKLGRRTLILTVPLLHMLGIDLDRPAVGVTGEHACAHAYRPPNVHDVDGGKTP